MPNSPKKPLDTQSTPRQVETKQVNRTTPVPVKDEDFDITHVRRVVATNPNTPRQVLARLSRDEVNIIRRGVASNPKTSVDILCELAADRDSDVRLAIAENPNTPPHILASLAEDGCVDVRFGVAENPHMPEEILLILSQDENPYIRCRALKTLQMLAPDVQSRLRHLIQSMHKRQMSASG